MRRRRSAGRATQPPEEAGGAQRTPSLELLQSVVERSLDEQERQIASLDQRGGVLLGFSGLLVSLDVRLAPHLSLSGVVSAALSVLATLCAALEILPRSTDRVRPRALLERYAGDSIESHRSPGGVHRGPSHRSYP